MVNVIDQGTQLTCVIASEDDAWELLRRVVDNEFGDRFVEPEFRKWPDLRIKFWKDDENRVLTAPMMEGLLEVQAALYRTFLLVEEDTSNLRHLSEYYRDKFEIGFRINSGSTEAEPKWIEIAQQFVTAVAGKMSGRHATIVILGAMLSFAGYSSWTAYLDSKAEMAKSEASNNQIAQILESHRQADAADIRRLELLKSALDQTPDGQAILEASDEAKEGVLRSAKRVDSTSIGQVVLEPEAARRMSRIPRAEAYATNESGYYEILRNDTTVENGFRVRLKNIETGEKFFAELSDNMVAPDQKDLIMKAEWEKHPISATIAATRRRGEIVRARILSATDAGG